MRPLASTLPLPIDASTDCIKLVGTDGRLLSMNPDGLCLMEIEDFGAVEGALWSSLWPPQHRPTLDGAVAMAAAGSVARFSADCPTAKGTPKHWDVMVSPVYGRDGDLTNLMVVSRDVTRDVLIAGERALVARELSHRIANLFTIVDGIIRLSARATPTAAVFAETLRTRLSGLGRAVRYVYSGLDDGPAVVPVTVQGLLRELLAPYGAGAPDGGVSISGDDLVIDGAVVTPLALIFNELATNALKYGALAHAGGAVAVRTAQRGSDFVVLWDEQGPAVEAPTTPPGFGTTLVQRTVEVQLGGVLTRDWTSTGLQVEIVAPLARFR